MINWIIENLQAGQQFVVWPVPERDPADADAGDEGVLSLEPERPAVVAARGAEQLRPEEAAPAAGAAQGGRPASPNP